MYCLVLKSIHILAVILFMGNITTGLFWMHNAVRSRNGSIINHTIKAIIKADMIFTIPGVVMVVASGIWLAFCMQFPIFKLGWILWSIILFSASGIAFAVKVAPLQKQIAQLTSRHEKLTDSDWESFAKLMRKWDFWGMVALLTPFISFLMMVLKIPQ